MHLKLRSDSGPGGRLTWRGITKSLETLLRKCFKINPRPFLLRSLESVFTYSIFLVREAWLLPVWPCWTSVSYIPVTWASIPCATTSLAVARPHTHFLSSVVRVFGTDSAVARNGNRFDIFYVSTIRQRWKDLLMRYTRMFIFSNAVSPFGTTSRPWCSFIFVKTCCL